MLTSLPKSRRKSSQNKEDKSQGEREGKIGPCTRHVQAERDNPKMPPKRQRAGRRPETLPSCLPGSEGGPPAPQISTREYRLQGRLPRRKSTERPQTRTEAARLRSGRRLEVRRTEKPAGLLEGLSAALTDEDMTEVSETLLPPLLPHLHSAPGWSVPPFKAGTEPQINVPMPQRVMESSRR